LYKPNQQIKNQIIYGKINFLIMENSRYKYEKVKIEIKKVKQHPFNIFVVHNK